MTITHTIIQLRDIELYAYHGVLPQEQRVGNHYSVTLTVALDAIAAMQSDDLSQGLNYALLHEVVVEEMAQPSQLLEHVAHRILSRIGREHSCVHHATISITKKVPPITGFRGAGITFEAHAEYPQDRPDIR